MTTFLSFEEALKIQQTAGPEHLVYAARGLSNLGACLLDQQKFAEAEPVLNEALAKTRSVLGEDHPYTATCLYQMARFKMLTGNKGEAEQHCSRALAIQMQRLGPDSQVTKQSKGLLEQIQGKG